jgi:hypothetical protein
VAASAATTPAAATTPSQSVRDAGTPAAGARRMTPQQLQETQQLLGQERATTARLERERTELQRKLTAVQRVAQVRRHPLSFRCSFV